MVMKLKYCLLYMYMYYYKNKTIIFNSGKEIIMGVLACLVTELQLDVSWYSIRNFLTKS